MSGCHVYVNLYVCKRTHDTEENPKVLFTRYVLCYVALDKVWLPPIIFIGTHSLALVETDSAK
ncbi:hypothetical protein SFRURICE_009598, partial [Spodoptera frugiperda]